MTELNNKQYKLKRSKKWILKVNLNIGKIVYWIWEKEINLLIFKKQREVQLQLLILICILYGIK